MRGEVSSRSMPVPSIVAVVIVSLVVFAIGGAPEAERPETWRGMGGEFVKANKNVRARKKAKNIVFFLGDGMGVTTVTAARILDGQQRKKNGERHNFVFDTFPHTALSKTYSYDYQTTDSAAGMTAPMSGVKTRNGLIGVDQDCERGDASAVPDTTVPTMLEIAEALGKSTGVVTSTRVTHATPAACFAHSANRDWEYSVPEGAERYQDDIAVQSLGDLHGDGMEVILGGGRRGYLPDDFADPEDEGSFGRREDDRNLTEEWTRDLGGTYVWNKEQFDAVDPASCNRLLGLFERSHCEYEHDRPDDTGGEPSLSEMTGKAIDILSKNKRGYFLMVEGGRIDHAHHANNAFRSLSDTIELARAVEVAMRKCDLKKTLIIVTADHSHAFAMNGYARRDNPILGLVESPGGTAAVGADGHPYPVLAYGVGGKVEAEGAREVLTQTQAQDPDFRQAAAYPGPSGQDTHAGEDVPVYAQGPGSHLVRGTIENTQIFYVMLQAFGGAKRIPRNSGLEL